MRTRSLNLHRLRTRPSLAKYRKIDLRKTLFLLPNMITLASIFCGFDSIRTSAFATGDDDYYRAALLLVFALIFDTLDGRVARLTKTQSAFGLQIDSLADVVSFGVAPGLLVYKWSIGQIEGLGFVASFVFVAAGAIRLARFNVLSMNTQGAPTKPGKFIVGLPIPGAAGILMSLVLANHAAGGNLRAPQYAWPIAFVTVLASFLMISTVKFRTFKDVRLTPASVALVCFAIGSSAIVSMQTKPAFVLVWLLSFYVGIGIIESIFGLSQKWRGVGDKTPPSQQ